MHDLVIAFCVTLAIELQRARKAHCKIKHTSSGLYMAAPLMLCDVIVDGKYVDNLKDHKLKWRGSSNQHVIDVHASVRDGLKVHLWTE